MRHILVLQWLGSSEAEFNVLVDMEDILDSQLGEAGSVDGHDLGSGEMNIFIDTDHPAQAFAAAKEILGDWPAWADVRAAFREASREAYELLWPPELTHFSVK